MLSLFCFAEDWRSEPLHCVDKLALHRYWGEVLNILFLSLSACMDSPAAARQFYKGPDLSSCSLHAPPSISGCDLTPDSLLQGPSWTAAAASCLLTPLPPLLPVLGQTRLKPPLPYPTPHHCRPLILSHSWIHTLNLFIVLTARSHTVLGF